MNHLSPEEIIKLQIKLLESSGKTLTTLHKLLLLGKTQKEANIFHEFDKKNLSAKIRKMIVANVQSMGEDANANLRVFSVIILKLIYGRQLDEQTLSIIKNHLHKKETDLTRITNIPKASIYYDLSSISNQECKKILIQFFHSAKTSPSKIQNLSLKYPLALQLMVILFRSILLTFNIPQAHNYSQKISTTAAYQILFQFLDIFYYKNGRLYLLRDQNLFIQNGYEDHEHKLIEEIVYGNYYENEEEYMKTVIKNMNSSGNIPLFESQSTKVGSSSFNTCQFHIKYQNMSQTMSVNPFELLLPKGSSILFQGDPFNSPTNRSLKGSNAFAKNYNLSSNRSQASVNLEDSQCDNPTPSFNQISQQQTFHHSNPFQSPHNQSETQPSLPNPRSPRQIYIMKESATILPSRSRSKQTTNKAVLKSSLLEDLQNPHNQSLQLEKQTSEALKLKDHVKNDITGLDTSDSPINNQTVSFMPDMNSFQQRERSPSASKPHNKHFSQEEKHMMKRSQSEKNSMIKHSITNQEDEQSQDQNRPSLFAINCKRLKTSVQLDEKDFFSQKKFVINNQPQFDSRNLKELCQHSNYTCSCHSLKLQRNKIYSNTLNFLYQPKKDITYMNKKQAQLIDSKESSNLSVLIKPKSKLDDEFFKRLRAKREEQKKNGSKGKSDHRSKEQKKNFTKKPFIKYSQIVQYDQKSSKSRSNSITPDKSTVKRSFPVNFKKLDTFFNKPMINPQIPTGKSSPRKLSINCKQSRTPSKQPNCALPAKINPNMSQKVIPASQIIPKNPNPNFSLDQKAYYMYSTPITPVKALSQINALTRNQTFQEISVNFQPNGKSHKSNFSVFSPQSSNGFGFGSKNDDLFYNPTMGK